MLVTVFTSGTLFADANVDKNDTRQSYLLSAPGTITGNIKPQKEVQAPQHSFVTDERFANPTPYQFIQDHYNFPQYGQLRAHPNPWLDRPAARQSLPVSPGSRPQYDNPWDIQNLPSLESNGYQNKPMPGDGMMDPAYGFYGNDYGSSSFYPRFNTPQDHGLPRPSSAAGFPGMNGLMPGLGNDDGSFPFMPFGMF